MTRPRPRSQLLRQHCIPGTTSPADICSSRWTVRLPSKLSYGAHNTYRPENLCLRLPARRGAGREGSEQEVVWWGRSDNEGRRRCGNSHLGDKQLLLVTDRAYNWLALIRMTLKYASQPWTGRATQLAKDVPFTAPKNSKDQWEIWFRLCWGLFKWLTSVHRKRSFPQRKDRGRNCIMLQLWVLLATLFIERENFTDCAQRYLLPFRRSPAKHIPPFI